MAPPPKPDLGRSAATGFMNVRRASGAANPFANVRVGSSTGPRYVPPAVSASRHLEGLHNAPRPEASQAAMEDYRRTMSQLGMGSQPTPPMPQAGPLGSMGTPPMGPVNTRGMGPSAVPPSTNVTTQQDMMGRAGVGRSLGGALGQLGMGMPAGSPAFKKGGMVKAKPKAAAPVKKKAGGMIAKPKPKAAVAAPKAKGKAMPAFKKGGAVKAKGKR